MKNAAEAGGGADSDVSMCPVVTDGSEEYCRGW